MSWSTCLLRARALGCNDADGRSIFTSVDAAVGAGRIGLVGPNGVGKSSLLDVLAGVRPAAAGSVERAARLAYLPQRAALDQLDAHEADATVAGLLGVEAKLAALRRIEGGDASPEAFDALGDDWGVAERAAAWLARLGLPPALLPRALASLSGGERTRARIAGLLREDPSLIILDEPTNHLDRDGREALLRFVAGWAGGLIAASHDRELLRAMDAIWELTPQGLRVYGGNYDAYVAQRAAEDQAAEDRVQAARQTLKRAREGEVEAREKQERRMARGKRDAPDAGIPKILLGAMKRNGQRTLARVEDVHGRRVAAAEGELAAASAALRREATVAIDLPEPELPRGKLVLELRGVNVAPPGSTAPLWHEPLDAVIAGPSRIALVGANGAGKSTLLKALRGEVADGATLTGEIVRHVRRIAYLDQMLGGFDASRPLLELMRDAAPATPETERRVRLGRFLFEGKQAERPLGELSGGERLRAALALTLAADEPPQLLLLDEPTSHLDLASVERLEEALAGFKGALIVASHDPDLLDRIGCEHSWRLTRG